MLGIPALSYRIALAGRDPERRQQCRILRGALVPALCTGAVWVVALLVRFNVPSAAAGAAALDVRLESVFPGVFALVPVALFVCMLRFHLFEVDVVVSKTLLYGSLAGVIAQFRAAFGTKDWPRLALPSFLLDLGTRLADAAARLGWLPPMRSTAMIELRRGVAGDPRAWMQATGIVPRTLAQMVGQRPASIQDKWFARLFLIKALVIASLVVFWFVSGFIALSVSYDAAAGILAAHRFPPSLVAPITIATSLMDMSIGILIACRGTCAIGLVAGIAASLGYMLGAAVLTPDLWIEPLGALVKTGPAIVLMLVALLILDNR